MFTRHHANHCRITRCILCLQGEKKEEKTGDAEAEKEAEKTEQKPQKKTKISEEIAVELLANDISDPTAEDILSSNKKYVLLVWACDYFLGRGFFAYCNGEQRWRIFLSLFRISLQFIFF